MGCVDVASVYVFLVCDKCYGGGVQLVQTHHAMVFPLTVRGIDVPSEWGNMLPLLVRGLGSAIGRPLGTVKEGIFQSVRENKRVTGFL